MRKIVFTCGDVNGIGPEIVLKCINKIYAPGKYKLYFIMPKNVFEKTAADVDCQFNFRINKQVNVNMINTEVVDIIDIGNCLITPGLATKQSGETAFYAIKKSFEIINTGQAEAVVTAPISKYALSLAGINYPGHTEMFAEWCNVSNFVMMFFSAKMNCALYSIHEPIRRVPALLKTDRFEKTIKIIIKTLQNDFKKKKPHIAVLGLNPHAGENGRIGQEEEKILIPAMHNSEYHALLSGPFVPDAFFANKLYKKYDLTLGMYHDQVLIPFKMLNFASGVNYTAGLPIIRTSPDHGTAYDIAGKNKADYRSLEEAFRLALNICNNRNN